MEEKEIKKTHLHFNQEIISKILIKIDVDYLFIII